ncbi:aldehyde dehydrogenase [Arthrobacter ginkgonis]|uniref:aldehyde dehydrogenase (NAD(+)) n=1 Tax=Arthrobacter ginkgonis TaxID=1630594 RepID=A0ABP7C4Y7_9MICC
MNVRNELFIDGRWHAAAPGPGIAVMSPATEEQIGRVPDASVQEVDLAVTAARHAFDAGPWPHLSTAERAQVLERALANLEPKLGEIANLVTAQMGLPTTISRQKAPAGLWVGRYFLDLAREQQTLDLRETRFGPAAVLREPVGVVAAIAPWNSPFNMSIAKVVPALATGCTVVYKPAPETPLDSYLLAEALEAAGLPAGVFNLVTGGRETGRALTAHPGVDKISFTGSTAAGREIARAAGPRFARLQLELGGKSAAIIASDADPAKVIRGIADGTFSNTGQTCSAFSRVLVPSGERDQWVEVLAAAARSFTIGDPFDPATTLGPLASAAQHKRVNGYLALGQSEGARIAVGGGTPAGLERGHYLEPTVLVDADNSMRVSREEIFGPVAVVIGYDGLEEAIAIANDTRYGLHGGVFTEDPATAAHVARSVRAGSFTINRFAHNVQVPFGGVKDSGVGRELGAEGLQAFQELKTVNLTEETAGVFG